MLFKFQNHSEIYYVMTGSMKNKTTCIGSIDMFSNRLFPLDMIVIPVGFGLDKVVEVGRDVVDSMGFAVFVAAIMEVEVGDGVTVDVGCCIAC